MRSLPRKLGWVPDYPDQRDRPFRAIARASAPLRRLTWLPQSLDQGELGSCVSNAIATAVQYDRIRQKKLEAWSPSRLFNYYNARAVWGWESIDSGAMIRDGIKSMANEGNVPENEWPYDVSKFTVRPPHHVYAAASVHKSLLYRRVEQSLEDMRACIAQDLPFVFGFTVYSSFPWHEHAVEMPSPGDTVLGGHAVLCVGYDDVAKRFEFQNSWGESWGHFGRGTIPYDYLTNQNLSSDFWCIETVE